MVLLAALTVHMTAPLLVHGRADTALNDRVSRIPAAHWQSHMHQPVAKTDDPTASPRAADHALAPQSLQFMAAGRWGGQGNAPYSLKNQFGGWVNLLVGGLYPDALQFGMQSMPTAPTRNLTRMRQFAHTIKPFVDNGTVVGLFSTHAPGASSVVLSPW